MEACCALRLEPVTLDGFNETIERQNKQKLKQEELETNSGVACSVRLEPVTLDGCRSQKVSTK